MSEQYKPFLERALELAKTAALQDEVPVGAVVVYENKIIAEGYNRREQDQNFAAHAELIALQEATRALGSWRLNHCTLIVTLEPCPMCLAASQSARIRKLVYGALDPKGGSISLGYALHQDLRMNHRFDVDYMPLKECGQVLSEFFLEKRKVKK